LRRFLRHRSLASAIALTLAIGCSGTDTSAPLESAQGSAPSGAVLVSRPKVPPQIPNVSELDVDGDRLDDQFADEERAIRAYLPSREAIQAVLDAPVMLEAIFDSPIGAKEIAAFEREGGVIRHVFKHVSYGFTGSLPRSALARTSKRLGPSLLLLHGERYVERHLDEATRTGRVRPVWATSFHGGYSGSPNIVIAIVDGGVDASHPDLAGRMAGWKDYTSEDVATAQDLDGHGTHVAGIAVGSGAAFGIGPDTLKYTDSGNATGLAVNDSIRSPVHLPPTCEVTSVATWLGGGTTRLTLDSSTDGGSGTYTPVVTIEGTSPLSLSFSGAVPPGLRHTLALHQNGSITRFSIVNSVTNYPAVGDGFNALRGVAAGSHWYGAKVFPAATDAVGTTTDIVEAMDDIIDKSVTLNIKVANMSFGVIGGQADSTQRSKANTMVDNGIVVVSSAGNSFANTQTGDPGRAANVITVGATNDQNTLTAYTSGGFTGGTADTDVKPDLLAPGGSVYRSKILSVDTNDADADLASFADKRANDYTQIMGTSMAAPFVAGSAALLIQALEESGTAWSFGSTGSPFLVKLLLLASSTETNRTREVASTGPALGRGLAQKDNQEGYGLISPDAAIEAATVTYDFAPLTGTTTGGAADRRAWGRKIVVPAGRTLKLSLDVADTADFDIYVYESVPDAKGNPILLAWGDRAGLGLREELTWHFTPQTTLYAFVKRISGSGGFTLTGSTFVCGDGQVDTRAGEECDFGPDVAGDCCSVACQYDNVGTACGDAGSCTTEGVCGPFIEQDAGTDAGPEEDAGIDAGDAGPLEDAGLADAGPGYGGGGRDATVVIDDITAPPGVSNNDGFVGGGGCSTSRTRCSSWSTSFFVVLGLFALGLRSPGARRRRR
jgi:subtilisin family serine protease